MVTTTPAMSTSTPDGQEGPVPRPVPAADLGEALRLFAGHPSGRLLLVQAGVLGAVRAAAGPLRRQDVAVAAGVAVWWPFQEWLAHRYVLHAAPRRLGRRTVDPAVARYHRRHHADPWDLEHTMLPSWFLLPAAPVHVALWLVAMPTRRLALTGMLATTVATIAYEWTHFLTHTGYRPRRGWFRKLQRRHRLHHFKHEQRWYGFTVPFVDDLFGTAPDPSTVPTSPTVRTLGVEDHTDGASTAAA
ncbi:MAG: sterol desaturase family protein [Acidimicrobiia bacterium]|nr:sterol desaturase family protein [Acidimicrobiia bacterium]